MYYIGVRDGKRERKQTKSQFGHTQCVYENLKTLVLIEAKKFITINVLGEKEKWTNKGNDKQQHVDSLLHNTTSHTQHLYQISKS